MENPALLSCWKVVGKKYQFQIVDFWSTGWGDKYKRTFYELKYKHKASLQLINADRFHELIAGNKIELTDN